MKIIIDILYNLAVAFMACAVWMLIGITVAAALLLVGVLLGIA